MKILVTGGAGYIGSHTVVELVNEGHEVVIADNLANSSVIVLDRIKTITGTKPNFYKVDVIDKLALLEVFKQTSFDAVIHFSALKSVGKSISNALSYYKNNVGGLLTVLECMSECGVKRIIFSSSATVYGTPESVPLFETSRVGIGITNPYGQSKMICEQILTDCTAADLSLQVTLLRYFNPAGAHESGLIGEDPSDIPNNLMPYVSQVAVGKLKSLQIFGDDYDSPDGTGVRDYIHVVDLAKGHLAALSHSPASGSPDIYNLGSGKGYSVLEIVDTFQKASKKEIPYVIVPRREGDVAQCYADSSKALQELSWKTTKSLNEICEDSWRWQSKNPEGYQN